MQVHEGMSHDGPHGRPRPHSLRAVARLMSQRRVGAAVVMDPDGPRPGIITERDILVALGAGQDPDAETVADHLTRDVVFAAPDWSLEEAAAAMVRGGFRHLIVLDQGETVGSCRFATSCAAGPRTARSARCPRAGWPWGESGRWRACALRRRQAGSPRTAAPRRVSALGRCARRAGAR